MYAKKFTGAGACASESWWGTANDSRFPVLTTGPPNPGGLGGPRPGPWVFKPSAPVAVTTRGNILLRT